MAKTIHDKIEEANHDQRQPPKKGITVLPHNCPSGSIDIFKQNKNVGYFSILLPVHLAYVVIPAEVAQTIGQKGDRFEFKVQIETKDKNNRTYSKPLIVKEKLAIPQNKM